MKDTSRSEIETRENFYSSFSENSVNILEEVDRFFANPEKNYVRATVDLFIHALPRGLSVIGKMFKIDAQGNIIEIDIGEKDNPSNFQCYFARTISYIACGPRVRDF